MSLIQISSLPEEMLEMILLEVAVMKASRHLFSDNNDEIYRDLAVVCQQWKRIIEGDEFCKMFLDRVHDNCEF